MPLGQPRQLFGDFCPVASDGGGDAIDDGDRRRHQSDGGDGGSDDGGGRDGRQRETKPQRQIGPVCDGVDSSKKAREMIALKLLHRYESANHLRESCVHIGVGGRYHSFKEL